MNSLEKGSAFLAYDAARWRRTWCGGDGGILFVFESGTNTAFTNANGATLSHAEFPTNDRIVDFFEQGMKSKRILD
jgi:hypothetical protein